MRTSMISACCTCAASMRDILSIQSTQTVSTQCVFVLILYVRYGHIERDDLGFCGSWEINPCHGYAPVPRRRATARVGVPHDSD